MPTLDDIWNSAQAPGAASPAPAVASMDALWKQSKAPQNEGTFLHPVKPTEPGWGSVGKRIMQYPGLVAGKVADVFKSVPEVASGSIDPTTPEGAGKALDIATMVSPLAPMRAGVMAAAKGAARGAAPTREALFDEADRLYGELRKNDVPLRKEVVEDFSNQVRDVLNDRGFYKEDQPATFRALERLKNPVGEHSTAKEVYAARTSLNNAVRDNPGKSEAAAAEAAMQHLDSYLSNVPGFAETATKARGNYRAANQSERVGKATERGELNASTSATGGNLDNALRQRIKALLVNDKVPKTPEEAELMKAIARGDTVGNIARLFSRLGPKHPGTAAPAAIAADLTGGGGLASLSVAVGALAQYISERATTRKIGRLDEMIRGNSPLGRQPSAPPRVVTPPTSGALAPAAGSPLAIPNDALSPLSSLDFSFVGTANAAEDKPRSKFEPEQSKADKITPRPLVAKGAPQSFAQQMEARRRAVHPADSPEREQEAPEPKEREQQPLVSKESGGQDRKPQWLRAQEARRNAVRDSQSDE